MPPLLQDSLLDSSPVILDQEISDQEILSL